MQVIIYSNESGGVSVCIPSGEVPILEVQKTDTPAGSIIIDNSTLPQNNRWFDAWELNGSTVTVNLDKAKVIALKQANDEASQEYVVRQRNTALGIPNEPSDQVWLQMVEAKRNAINNATTIAELDLL